MSYELHAGDNYFVVHNFKYMHNVKQTKDFNTVITKMFIEANDHSIYTVTGDYQFSLYNNPCDNENNARYLTYRSIFDDIYIFSNYDNVVTDDYFEKVFNKLNINFKVRYDDYNNFVTVNVYVTADTTSNKLCKAAFEISGNSNDIVKIFVMCKNTAIEDILEQLNPCDAY